MQPQNCNVTEEENIIISLQGMLEHEAWIMNLTEANIGPSEPKWFKLYDGRETFGLNSLSAQDMSNLVDRFIVDDELFQTYYR